MQGTFANDDGNDCLVLLPALTANFMEFTLLITMCCLSGCATVIAGTEIAFPADDQLPLDSEQTWFSKYEDGTDISTKIRYYQVANQHERFLKTEFLYSKN